MAKQDKNATFVGDSRISAKRMPNVSPSYSDYPGTTEPFWPNFLLKEWMVAAVCLLGFLVLTVSHESPLTAKADPNDTSFIPVPDWYFLFLYQLLKYPWAAGDHVLLGVIGIPGIAFGAMILAPFLDTGKDRRPIRRPVATGLMLLSLFSIFFLTWAAHDEHEKQLAKLGGGSGGGGGGAPAAAAKADPNFKADPLWAANQSCIGCHGGNLEGGMGPNLQKIGSTLSAEDIHKTIAEGKGDMPGGMFKGSDEDLKKLVDYLASLK
ncbi:menaquinol-cytochrome c reductase cytochrome b/c subunit [Brevibacillus laterosporus]|uniref:Cytochrome b subunit protein B6 n=1 Tax=Brevibacillus laterosporus LMG 15441 TaxID=1042163 RepID=A0A075R111_BRELA|nr:menaquinol-cytochrome c reductase cytochrome b/c subunit [Brevibacillus laterosporus]AIG26262.1 cytochrome b subunit protein B6 [Brevibacillus laterosporus LMG 15441]AYK07837.1 cytochrome C oxidase Cbb3 [Brevibacillus laterosporus]ERM20129.1 cytochrome CBB3 [Brevibacillus laterosporus PE36]RJL12408.1 cytochrome C oxidase Cbb3 [Brevibacillus laterosporus]TPH07391.1 cytochrome C oxidase Cbb3 [Brevibacillus laterosporus]